MKKTRLHYALEAIENMSVSDVKRLKRLYGLTRNALQEMARDFPTFVLKIVEKVECGRIYDVLSHDEEKLFEKVVAHFEKNQGRPFFQYLDTEEKREILSLEIHKLESFDDVSTEDFFTFIITVKKAIRKQYLWNGFY